MWRIAACLGLVVLLALPSYSAARQLRVRTISNLTHLQPPISNSTQTNPATKTQGNFVSTTPTYHPNTRNTSASHNAGVGIVTDAPDDKRKNYERANSTSKFSDDVQANYSINVRSTTDSSVILKNSRRGGRKYSVPIQMTTQNTSLASGNESNKKPSRTRGRVTDVFKPTVATRMTTAADEESVQFNKSFVGTRGGGSSDVLSSQSARNLRVLLQPTKRNSSKYNFETGRVLTPLQNSNISQSNDTHNDHVQKYSARYQQNGQEPESKTNIDNEPQGQEHVQHQEVAKDGGVGGAEGKGEEHHADVHSLSDIKHTKGYQGDHHYDKGSKGFHNKEGHQGEYKDEKGSKKGHKEAGGHFESGQHGEKGEKASEHAEKEEYKKGHSTRGGHVVHKKDEFEKRIEFYDESHEGGHGEKFGAYFESYAGKKGGHKKGGHKDGSSVGKHHAKKGHFTKGGHSFDDKGHDDREGSDGIYAHQEKYGKQAAHKDAKQYAYSHMHPEKDEKH